MQKTALTSHVAQLHISDLVARVRAPRKDRGPVKRSCLNIISLFVLMATGCDPDDESVPLEDGPVLDAGEEPAQAPEEPLASASDDEEAIPEVSPELFNVIVDWIEQTGEGRDGGPTLHEFVREVEPSLLGEAEELTGRFDEERPRGNCACTVLGAIDGSPATKVTEVVGNWSSEAEGAAHRGSAYRSAKKSSSEYSTTRSNHTTLSLQLVCLDAQAHACQATCSGKLYVYGEYGTSLYGWSNTSGIWSRAAQGAAADGAKLTYEAPFVAPQVLFDKAGSVTHRAKGVTFDEAEVINLVRNGLSIAAAVKTAGWTGIDTDLVTRTLTSLAKLIQRSGNNGATDNQMFVAYDSRTLPPFIVNYQPLVSQVHKIRLTTQGNTKNRGWGPWNEDHSVYASGYLLAAAVDHFQCNGGAPPQRGGLWRYATTTGAPYTENTLREMVQGFFTVLGVQVNVQASSGKTF